VRDLLSRLPVVRSVTQLGLRLHALLDPDVPEPAALIRNALAAAGLEARVDATEASLEDVFVAATAAPAQDAAAA